MHDMRWNVEQTNALLDSLFEQIDARLGQTLALVAIRRGGLPVVAKLRERFADKYSNKIDVGEVDIALYRDDAATALPDPKIGPSRVTFDVEGRDVVIVDDVLQTGRTIRAAIECLQDFGRPRRVWLGVLIDRGGRELPIAPDFCAEQVELEASVRLKLVDGPEGLCVVSKSRD